MESDNVNENEPMPMPGSQEVASTIPESESDEPMNEESTDAMNESEEVPEGESVDVPEEVPEEVPEGESVDVPEEVPEEVPEGEYVEGEEESVEGESKPARAQVVLKKASNFRQKLTKTKRKLASLDDSQKEKIRSELINEFVGILKLYKHKTTRKKYIRRLNGLRTAFNQSLNKLNGTTRQRRRKSKKQQPVEYSQEPVQNEPEEVPSSVEGSLQE
jgi:hypothetical protein